jgi:hypothetical protein
MTKVITIGTPNTVTVDTNSSINIVTVSAQGPQGPQGSAGAGFPFSGSAIITGSLYVTSFISSSFTGSLLGTASYALNSVAINTGSFVTTSSFNAYTSSTNNTLAGKANLNGGNTFTGTQNVTKVVASDSIVSPIYQGSTAKVQILNGETKEIFRYTTGLYSSLILDAFLKIDEDPTQYAIQTVYIIVNPANEGEIYITSITAVSSPAASGTPPNYENATFTPTTIIYSAELSAGYTIINLQNQTGLGTINYKSIVRSFTTTG